MVDFQLACWVTRGYDGYIYILYLYTRSYTYIYILTTTFFKEGYTQYLENGDEMKMSQRRDGFFGLLVYFWDPKPPDSILGASFACGSLQ